VPDVGEPNPYIASDVNRRTASGGWFFSFQSVMTGPAGDSSLFGCVGNHNREKKPAFPRMHNKFLVFCNASESTSDLDYRFEVKPHTVWTGSFNLTRNAAMSLENALAITDPTVVQAYFREWEQVLALSEPLDWSSDWCEPEWRVGT
jgi:hypothetical protein